MPSRFEYERSVRSSDLAPLSRLLALTLATWADVKTGVIPTRLTPSLSTLEEATGMDRSTVRRHLNKLESAEWVGRDRPDPAAARAKKARTRYRLTVPKGASVPDSDGYELGAEDTEARGTQPLAEAGLGAQRPMTRGTQPLELGAENPITRGTVPPKSSYGPERSTEVQLQQGSGGRAPAADDDALRVIQPLIDEMTRRGMRVSWQMQIGDWKELVDLVQTRSVPVLVDHAERVWQSAKTAPYSARYFLAGWRGLPDTPAGPPPQLRAVSGGWQPFKNPENHDVYDEPLI
ncbi:helix-turn-helix domain-containing protein [Streptomyces sp. NPDC094149]|uniref:helix-turn-helix domain-containing protein n=1 Tax=Streptomyces sp. NPDC094149 TaxID=3155079 RepID=UPI00332948B1